MELFYVLLGGYMIYSIVHLFIMQSRTYKNLTKYERFVTIFADITIAIIFLSVALGD